MEDTSWQTQMSKCSYNACCFNMVNIVALYRGAVMIVTKYSYVYILDQAKSGGKVDLQFSARFISYVKELQSVLAGGNFHLTGFWNTYHLL